MTARVVDESTGSLRQQAGDVVEGKYRLGRRLGEVAIGAVFEAVDVLLERKVAIKFIRSDCELGLDARTRVTGTPPPRRH